MRRRRGVHELVPRRHQPWRSSSPQRATQVGWQHKYPRRHPPQNDQLGRSSSARPYGRIRRTWSSCILSLRRECQPAADPSSARRLHHRSQHMRNRSVKVAWLALPPWLSPAPSASLPSSFSAAAFDFKKEGATKIAIKNGRLVAGAGLRFTEVTVAIRLWGLASSHHRVPV